MGSTSRPTRARGLKFKASPSMCGMTMVAPHAGAWIEIFFISNGFSTSTVAPHAGAWIEIVISGSGTGAGSGRAPRGRVD